MADAPKRSYTVREAAERLGKSPETVRRMAQDGRLPLVGKERSPGRQGWRYTIPAEAVESRG